MSEQPTQPESSGGEGPSPATPDSPPQPAPPPPPPAAQPPSAPPPPPPPPSAPPPPPPSAPPPPPPPLPAAPVAPARLAWLPLTAVGVAALVLGIVIGAVGFGLIGHVMRDGPGRGDGRGYHWPDDRRPPDRDPFRR